MSKWTPGPWQLWTSCSWRRFCTPDGMSVCEPVVQRSDGHPDLFFRNGGEDGPDARLIAAAPEMAALLKDIVQSHDSSECDSDGGMALMVHADTARALLSRIEGGP